MDKSENILEICAIDKRFGGVQALDQVSFTVRKGEVHAIVGENGAGKSTLMKILAGSYQADKGSIFIDGEEIELKTPSDSQRAGINIVYQEFYNFAHLSVVANVFAGREKRKNGFLDEQAMRGIAKSVFERLGVDIPLDANVNELSIAEQQIVEIAKAMAYEGKIVIMDEPNSALTDKETKALFGMIERLKQQGITILYVSHRMEEVFDICDRITALRDGKYIGTWDKNETTIPFIITKMVGRDIGDQFPERLTVTEDAPIVLEVKGLKKQDCLNDVNFQLREGEILGFAGLEGSGIRDLYHILFGLDHVEQGEVNFRGELQKIDFPDQAIQKRWAMVPANRRDHGLLLNWSVRENMTLVILKRLVNKLGLIRSKGQLKITKDFIRNLNIATDSTEKKLTDLSGGNQQKVVIAKWLASEPTILILDDPTRGIDVGAKAEIYELIHKLAKQGISILLTSSEIDEVLGLSTRLLVMRDGKIIKEYANGSKDKADVLQYVSGNLNMIEVLN